MGTQVCRCCCSCVSPCYIPLKTVWQKRRKTSSTQFRLKAFEYARVFEISTWTHGISTPCARVIYPPRKGLLIATFSLKTEAKQRARTLIHSSGHVPSPLLIQTRGRFLPGSGASDGQMTDMVWQSIPIFMLLVSAPEESFS